MTPLRDEGRPEIIEVEFRATLRLLPEDVADAGRDLNHAVQNVIGGTGAKLVGIDGAEVVGDA